jgi:dienelactone hydrolase
MRTPLLAVISLGALATPAAAVEQYWIAPAYEARPLKGPAEATGYVIWNHGLKGTDPQYQYPPARLVEGLAARGWDVVKLNRDPTYENDWSNAGKMHVRRLVAEIEAARGKGYKRIIIGGQSYGGAIALEAGSRVDGLWGVIATAPGTGQSTSYGSVTDRWSYAIASQTYDQLRALRPTRVVLVLPKDDEYISIARGPEARRLMSGRAMPFLLVDETVPIKGHGAANTLEFRPWATCINWFLDLGAAPGPGEFRCLRDELHLVLGSLGGKFPPQQGAPAWFGYFIKVGQEVLVSLHPDKEAGTVADYAWGKGLFATAKPGMASAPAERRASGHVFTLSNGAVVSATPEPDETLRVVFEKPGQDKLEAVLQPIPR